MFFWRQFSSKSILDYFDVNSFKSASVFFRRQFSSKSILDAFWSQFLSNTKELPLTFSFLKYIDAKWACDKPFLKKSTNRKNDNTLTIGFFLFCINFKTYNYCFLTKFSKINLTAQIIIVRNSLQFRICLESSTILRL